MSESQTESFSPAPGTAKSKRSSHVIIWLLVLLLAVAAFAAAFWYAGGTAALGQFTGLVSGFISPQPVGPVTPPRPAAAASATATASASALPAEAQQRMFAEQAESRQALTDLVDGKIATMKLGAVEQADASATVPLTAVYNNGSSISGTLTFKKYQDVWYFFSLANTKSSEVETPTPATFDSGVVETITKQQAQPGTQEIITQGLLGGGYKTVKVDSVTMGPRTATVDVTLSGGTAPAAKGRLVCISKADGSTTYWFVARFEKR